jgi:hypothetical protein
MRLVDDVDTALAAYDTVVAMTRAQGLQGIFDFHARIRSSIEGPNARQNKLTIRRQIGGRTAFYQTGPGKDGANYARAAPLSTTPARIPPDRRSRQNINTR